jgi:glutathione S-transferase
LFLQKLSSGTLKFRIFESQIILKYLGALKFKIFESQIILKYLGARKPKPKGLNRTDKID